MDFNDALSLLKITNLKPKQIEAIDIIKRRESALILLPTGYGKSYCFQLPALLHPKVTVVFSPLLALIEDQYKKLHSIGYPVQRYCTALNAEEKDEVLATLADCRILLTTPESFMSSTFQNAFNHYYGNGLIERFVFDEAHCLSSWGRDFRKSYQEIATLCRSKFTDIPVTALTATATHATRLDIQASLQIPSANEVTTSMFRSNLKINIYHRPTQKQMIQQIKQFFTTEKTGVGIIYSLSRKDCEKYSKLLREAGVSAKAYHAGLGYDEREKIQNDWTKGLIRTVVATVAFGMGIDQSNVRLVIHTNMPKCMDNYYQEIGRGGRDGKDCQCIMYYNYADKIRLHNMLGKNQESMETSYYDSQIEHLYRMYRYCMSSTCRHQQLVSCYGDDKIECMSCDNCVTETEIDKIPVSDSAVRIYTKTLEICKQQRSKKIQKTLLVKQLSQEHRTNPYPVHPEEIVNRMILNKFLQETVETPKDGKYYVIKLAVPGKMYNGFINKKINWTLPIRRKPRIIKAPGSKEVVDNYPDVCKSFEEELKMSRYRLALRLKRKSYQVLSNATLQLVAQLKPTTYQEGIAVKGIQDKRWNMIAEEMVPIIRKHSKCSSTECLGV